MVNTDCQSQWLRVDQDQMRSLEPRSQPLRVSLGLCTQESLEAFENRNSATCPHLISLPEQPGGLPRSGVFGRVTTEWKSPLKTQ